MVYNCSLIIYNEIMNNIQVEQALADYVSVSAKNKAETLCISDERINHIIATLGSLGASVDSPILSDQEAQSYFIGPRYSDSPSEYPDALQPETIKTLREVAEEIIQILAQEDRAEIYDILDFLTHAAWPLYSRDSSTDTVGFDLQEYVDIFASSTPAEKQKLASDILASWRAE